MLEKSHDIILNTVSNSITRVRHSANLTRAEFANKLGVSRQFIYNVERGLSIYWDKLQKRYVYEIPWQETTKHSVEATPTELFNDTSRYFEYMDIHSHNTMNAFFSTIDDKDEKGSKLYGVLGKVLDETPQMRLRISGSGSFVNVPVNQVFQNICVYDCNMEPKHITPTRSLSAKKGLFSYLLSILGGEER